MQDVCLLLGHHIVENIRTYLVRLSFFISYSESESESSLFQVAAGLIIFVEAPWVLGKPSMKLVGKLLNKGAESWR